MKEAIIEFTKSELFLLIGGIGTIGIVLTGISAWLGVIIIERLKQSWQKTTTKEVENLRGTLNKETENLKADRQKDISMQIENLRSFFNKEIETLKADRQKDTSIVTALLTQNGQINHKVLDKRITSIDVAWGNVLKIKATMPSVVSLTYTIFVDSEINNAMLNRNTKLDGSFGQLIDDIDIYSFTKEIAPITNEIQTLRPFLSQKLSLLLFVYGGVTGRLVFFLKESYSNGNAKPWRDDSGAKQLLNAVLLPEEIEFIYNKDNVQSFQQTFDLLEVKILDEMNKMLSGHMLADDAIALTRKWTEINKGAIQ